MRVAVVHGPNLNLLGQREPLVYGPDTLETINVRLSEEGRALGVEIESFQANLEGALIDYVQEAAGRVDGFVVNAGGYTHTSVALLDALVGVGKPYVEVHISNVAARENFRHQSLLSAKAVGVVTGFGPASYSLGLTGLVGRLRRDRDVAGGRA
ncbi:MAG: type II 3-dehydroquinate dehydratase [Longimicrobiales bacterium]